MVASILLKYYRNCLYLQSPLPHQRLLQPLLCFCDPCTLDAHPGWPLRNLLTLAAVHWSVVSLDLHVCGLADDVFISTSVKKTELFKKNFFADADITQRI